MPRPLLFGVAAAYIATPALADPCKAIPDRGPAPAWAKAGYVVSGTVRYVGDGDSICVSSSADSGSWVEIRLADWYAPELSEPGGRGAKVVMERITRGQHVSCTAVRGDGGRVVSYDRLIAVCRIRGVSLGELMRRQGQREGGRGR